MPSSRNSNSNRRRSRRLKIDRPVKVLIQLFPVLPFIGHSFEADLVNISAGGMAFIIDSDEKEIKRGSEIRIHFRLPGGPLCECTGDITHRDSAPGGDCIGIRFYRPPAALVRQIERMAVESALRQEHIEFAFQKVD